MCHVHVHACVLYRHAEFLGALGSLAACVHMRERQIEEEEAERAAEHHYMV